MTTDDDLDGWTNDLRTRLTCSELADVRPLDLGDGTGQLMGEQLIRIMLADLDDLNDPDGSWSGDGAWREERLSGLRDDFRRLRAQIS